MRARVALATLATALTGAVLPAATVAEEAPFIDWNPLLPSLATPYHPSRELDCPDGARSCIEETLSQMYDRFDRRYATCDHNAAFGITYIRVTEAIRRAERAGLYEEPAFLNHEDRVFARMYFEAYDAWRGGRRELVPPAWREAFDAGRDRSVSGLGNLLMSMNAHINRDFPFMLDALGLTMPDGRSRKPDHDRGNIPLNALYGPVLKELSQRFDPTVDDGDVPGLFAEDIAIFQVLQGWREQVWRHAEMLAAAQTPGQRKAVADYIEAYALQQGREIRRFTTISDSSSRDAHCAAYRRTHREKGAQLRIRLSPRGLLARDRGRVHVRVTCPEILRDCAGTAVLSRGGRRLTRARKVVLRHGESKVVRLRLSRRARRALARDPDGRMAVRARTSSPSPWGSTRPWWKVTRLRLSTKH